MPTPDAKMQRDKRRAGVEPVEESEEKQFTLPSLIAIAGSDQTAEGSDDEDADESDDSSGDESEDAAADEHERRRCR